MGIRAIVDGAWVSKMQALQWELPNAAKQGMGIAMEQSKVDAVGSAGWNPDGTIHVGTTQRGGRYKWETSGMSRATIAGYVVGKADAYPLAGQSLTDTYHRPHRTNAGVAPHYAEERAVIRGILTMYMDYSSYLQGYEEDRWGGPVVLRIIEQNEHLIWDTCRLYMLQAMQ